MAKTMAELKKHSPHLHTVLKKMCEAVGADVKTVDPSGEWYLKHAWSEEQEGKFRAWLENELYANAKMRQEVMDAPSLKTKKRIKAVVAMFLMCYGWRRA